MSEAIQGALIGALVALAVLVINTVVSELRDRRNARQAHLDRRYDSRVEACAAVLAEADVLEHRATSHDIEVQLGHAQYPIDSHDPWDRLWPKLDRAVARVALVGTSGCADAAEQFRKAVNDFAWTGKSADKIEPARDHFVAAARADLNVEPRALGR